MTFLVERTGYVEGSAGVREVLLGAAEFTDRAAAIGAAVCTWRRGRSATVVVRDADYEVIFARFAGPHSTKGRRIR